MPLEQRFCVGDRVRTIYAVESLGAGMRGTIVRAFVLASLYDVHFDGDVTTRFVAHYKLVPDLAEPIRNAPGTDDSASAVLPSI
jgi:hypothetical protein